MNTNDSPLQPSVSADSRSAGEHATTTGRALAALAVLLAAAALAGSGWLWWSDYRARGNETARQAAEAGRLGRLESEIDGRLQRLEAQLAELAASAGSERLTAQDERLQALERQARQAQDYQSESAAWARTLQASIEGSNARLAGLEARLEQLAARGLNGSAELDLAELDYLLRLAQERLQLFGDIRTADRALQIADTHVVALDSPLFSGLRREIGAARRALALVELPDPETLARELDGVQDRLATLPFRGEEVAAPEAHEPPATGWWARLKAALAGLVTVRRSTDESDRLPALADQELIRQRAWLEVERARLAAMRRDTAGFAAAAQRARQTIERWFEPRDRGTRAALQALESAAALDVDPELLDISAPWAALRALRAASGAAPAVETVPPEAGADAGDPATPEAETVGPLAPADENGGAAEDGR